MTFFGIRLIGLNAENGRKLLLTVGAIVVLVLLRYGLRAIARITIGKIDQSRPLFWTRQGINLLISVLLLLIIASVWFDDPQRLGTVAGLISAGVAFALQQPITSLAAY